MLSGISYRFTLRFLSLSYCEAYKPWVIWHSAILTVARIRQEWLQEYPVAGSSRHHPGHPSCPPFSSSTQQSAGRWCSSELLKRIHDSTIVGDISWCLPGYSSGFICYQNILSLTYLVNECAHSTSSERCFYFWFVYTNNHERMSSNIKTQWTTENVSSPGPPRRG